MKKLRINILCTLAVFAIFTCNSAAAAGAGTNIAVRLVGTDAAYPGTDIFDAYGIDGPPSLCWDFDMLDIKTGNVIGSVNDCAAIDAFVGTELGVGMEVTGTTFFYFPGGTLVSRSNTTVMPVTHGSPGYTHITGDVPAAGTDNVLYGDGKFKSATGTVRFSGIGDFTTLFEDGIITIDCLFTIDVDTGSK